MSNWGSLILFALLVAAAASIGAQFMPGEWYASLNRPTWTPPNWLFPVAWTILYIMIAVAGWLVWRRAGWSGALMIWGAGLVLNALWSYLMFGMHRIDLALIDIVALWAAIAAFIWTALPIDVRAAMLFAPYLAWVTFATALNFAIWRLN
jgi:translocator protein